MASEPLAAAPASTAGKVPSDGTSALTLAVLGSSPACPYRHAVRLQQALASDKMRVGFLLGAGCPLAIKVLEEGHTVPLIPDIAGLTEKIRTTIGESDAHRSGFAKILQRLGDSDANRQNIEQVLTHIRGLLEVVGNIPFDGMTQEYLHKLDSDICSLITKLMSKPLPGKDTPYHRLAEWIASIPRAHPVEVFTSNYDLLMEQAFEDTEVPYFDGFSGSERAFFDLTSMEHEGLPARWARLWKVHGSINWWRTNDKHVYRGKRSDSCDAQMIHPSHMKYEQSRKLPYFAMQDRLRAFLARGQAVMVTCGYSFQDYHLNRAILDGLVSNPTAVCFGLLWGDRAQAAEAVRDAGPCGNLNLLGVDGAVLRRRDHDWHSSTKNDDSFPQMAVSSGEFMGRTISPAGRCKFLLGDFGAFGEFLADQLASRNRNEGEGDGA